MLRKHPYRVLAGALAVLIVILLLSWHNSAAGLVVSLAQRVESLGWIAPLGFIALFTLAVPLLVPAAPFLLAGGILFGPALGILYGFLGNVLGGALAFALARYAFRQRVERRLASFTGFRVMTEALGREGARGAALIRFSPALPAWLINYALGVSPITWAQYWLSALSILPTTALYALSGSGLGDLAALEGGAAVGGFGYYALLAAAITGTLLASVLLGRRARKILETMNDA